MKKNRKDFTNEELLDLLQNTVPKSLQPLLPFLQPMMHIILEDVLEVKRQGAEHVQKKIADDSTLNAEEEEAKMKVRVTKKIKEILLAKLPEFISQVMVKLLNDPQLASEVFSQINLSKILKDYESMSTDLAGFVSKSAVNVAKMDGDSERAAFLEHQCRNPESAESKLLNYAVHNINVQELNVEGIKESIRQKGAHQFITSILLEIIYEEANRVGSEDKRIALETCINDDESHAYRVIGEQAVELERILDVLNLGLLNRFFKRAEYAVHKALEIDAEPKFNESRLLSRNRYFTKWSEEDHQKFLESRCTKSLGFF